MPMRPSTRQRAPGEDPVLTITCLHRDPEHGYWRARVTVNGETLTVDRAYGSWQCSVRVAPRSRTFERREVLPFVAARLQAKVQRLERREGATAIH